MADYDVLNSTKVFNGLIVNIVHDEILLPNGKTLTMEVATHPGAAAVVPIDPDGNIILVRQYRHSAKQYTLEIPAGKLNENENPVDAAKRELEEETGYITNTLKPLASPYTAIGFCTEIIHLYVANVVPTGTVNLDEGEFVTIEKHPLKEVKAMILDGRILDFKTITGILMLDLYS